MDRLGVVGRDASEVGLAKDYFPDVEEERESASAREVQRTEAKVGETVSRAPAYRGTSTVVSPRQPVGSESFLKAFRRRFGVREPRPFFRGANAAEAGVVVPEAPKPQPVAEQPRAEQRRKGSASKLQRGAHAAGKAAGAVWSEIGELFRRPPGVRAGLTLLGRLVVATPAIVPAVIVGFLVVGLMSVAGRFIVVGDTLGMATYLAHTGLSVLAVLVNAVLLPINTVLVGFATVFKVFIAGGMAVASGLFEKLFGAVYQAVNELIRVTPAIGGTVKPPTFRPENIATGPWLQFQYLVPETAVTCNAGFPLTTPDCGSLVRFNRLADGPLIQEGSFDVGVGLDQLGRETGQLAGGIRDGVETAWDWFRCNVLGRCA